MNIDAEIKAAQQRIHRSIGQLARHAHAEIRQMAEEARAIIEVRFHPDRAMQRNEFLGIWGNRIV